LSVSTQGIGTLIWVLIFGGLFVVGIGIALERSGESYGWNVIAAGALAIVVGCVLVWVRSRIPEP
jgi:hypothetical protein